MILEVAGDILLSGAAAVAHGVAPNDHFDQGLALKLRENWPAMAKDFRHYCRTHHPKPGTVWAWGNGAGPRIICMLTQEPAASEHSHPGRAKLESVNHALKALAQFVIAEKLTSLALPKLATGVGGLDWKDVFPLVQQHLGNLNIPVTVYSTYHPGVRVE